MLPLPLQFIIAMVAYAINERMARRIECLSRIFCDAEPSTASLRMTKKISAFGANRHIVKANGYARPISGEGTMSSIGGVASAHVDPVGQFD
jgi:hypothetical protein